MPWRSRTLTKYSVGSADNVNSDSDFDFQHVGDERKAASPGMELGVGYSEESLFGDLSHGMHDPLDKVFQSDDLKLVEGSSMQRQGALDLRAKLVPRGPTLKEGSFDQHLSHAFHSTRGPWKVEMPWEKGVFKKVFRKAESPLQNLFKQPRQWVGLDILPEAETMDDLSSAVGSRHQLVGALYEHALSSVSDHSFAQERQALLETAVGKWFCIIRVNMLASTVGRDIIGLGSLEDQKKGAFQVIEAVIGVRSRTTAVTRANALLKFLRWRADTSANDGKEFTELEAWQYVVELREKGSAPTRGTSFLSACNYAWHVFGFSGLEQVCASRRIKGLVEIMHSAKAPLKQALVLKVSQVKFLHEKLLDQDCNSVGRAIVAYLLIAFYGRCRHSDLQNVEDVVLDFGDEGGFMEITTRTHKTARTVTQKARLLPIVLPAIGITGCEWISRAKDAFEEYGLSLEGRIAGPLFRPPGAAGEPLCKRGITSQEVTRFLRFMLEDEASVQSEARLSSHSLKATVLSWASKACMSASDRAILGRHSSAYGESSAVYARDLAIGAVSRLQDVIKNICAGKFCPDSARSGYFPVQLQLDEAEPSTAKDSSLAGAVVKVEDELTEEEHAEQAPDESAVVLDESYEGSSDGSESMEDSDSGEEVARPAPKCFRHYAVGKLEGRFVVHQVSKLVHYSDPSLLDSSGGRMISCGRSLNRNYKYITQFDSVDVCKRYKSNAVKDGALPKALA